MVSTSRPSPRLDGYLVPGVSPAAFVAGLTFSCIDTGRPPAACPLHPFAHLAPTRLRPPPPAARDPHAHLDAIETQKKTPPKRGPPRCALNASAQPIDVDFLFVVEIDELIAAHSDVRSRRPCACCRRIVGVPNGAVIKDDDLAVAENRYHNAKPIYGESIVSDESTDGGEQKQTDLIPYLASGKVRC
jgi:hypothetical protein